MYFSLTRSNLNMTYRIALFLSTLFAAAVGNAGAGFHAERLRCERLNDPIGIDAARPLLDWRVAADRPDVRQGAYRVLVASRPELLVPGEADLWDTGRVVSGDTLNLRYEGAELTPHQRCYWRVRVWDQQGEASEWSDTASWATGLLGAPWDAEWIGYDAARARPDAEAPLEGAQWIGHPDDEPMAAPKGNRLYVARLDLPPDARIRKAEALIAADDKHWLAVNGKMVVHGEVGWERVKPVGIAETLTAGENELRINVENGSDGPSGLVARITIELEGGEIVTLDSGEAWLSHQAPGHHWPAEPLDASRLKPCRVIGSYGVEPWGRAALQGLFLPPVPRMRGEVQLEKPVAAATLYVTALGVCDAYLNGQRVSDEYFTPGWTDYAKRVYYRAYDVTPLLRDGANALGAELSDGWYSGYIGWGRNRDHYGSAPRARLQLHVAYTDGTSATFGTGPEWQATPGPTLEADFLMGETYDARLEDPDWSRPGFDDAGWESVDVGADFDAVVESHPGPPVVAVAEFSPVSVNEPEPGRYVFDLGQNFAGVARVRVRGRPGQAVTVRFAERLNEDGTMYVTNLRGARAVDTLLCSGGEDVWTPRHTFHGFQYVELSGLDAPPDAGAVTGVALSSDTPRIGAFECSDPTLNRLVENIYWTQRANFIEVPTDCPQRDERLGWTGDAQVYVGAASLNADVQAFFDKWLVDLVDAQRDDGQFPKTAPVVVAGPDGGPAWADAGVICPWSVYETYGDEPLLRRCYPAMKRFVEFCRRRSVDEVLPPEEYHCFGDWLSVNANTPHDVIYTAYYAHSTRLLAKAAEALGNDADAAAYHELADRIAAAFRSEYFDDEGTIAGDTQCGYVLALAYDLLDEQQQPRAAERLVADIEERGDHLSTGFVGTKDLMLALAKIGRNDVAYRLLHQDTYPSWGFSIRHGATSIWERWDGWTPDRGFQDPGMNSFAHYSFGAVYQWMVENIGGIRNGGGAYQHVVIEPTIDDRLDWARTEYESIRGTIRSAWRKEGDWLTLKVSLPANTSGEIRLPTDDPDRVTLDGRPLGEEERAITKVVEGRVVVTVASGAYEFGVDRTITTTSP